MTTTVQAKDNKVIKTSAAAVAAASSNTTAPTTASATATSSSDGNCRVFISNVPFKTTGEELREFLLKASPNVVKAEIISFASGRSKGYGIGEFKTPEDAQKAISQLNETQLMDRKVFVRENREQKPRSQRSESQENGDPDNSDGEGDHGSRGRGR